MALTLLNISGSGGFTFININNQGGTNIIVSGSVISTSSPASWKAWANLSLKAAKPPLRGWAEPMMTIFWGINFFLSQNKIKTEVQQKTVFPNLHPCPF